MKLMYWNTNGFIDFKTFNELLVEYAPDILFTSETSEELINNFKDEFDKIGYINQENPGCERVKIFARKNLYCELGIQNKFYTSIIVNNITIISVHLPSQMFHHLESLRDYLRKFRNKIDSEIGNSSEKSILIIGDLNVNPYEPALINFDGFMATNSIKARGKIKTIDSEDAREPYYNPSWRLYSNNMFPGTKKFPRPSGSSYDIIEFHLLDQVLISNKLKDSIEEDKIEIITSTSSYKLLNEQYNRVDYSDHLPLFYQFKTY